MSLNTSITVAELQRKIEASAEQYVLLEANDSAGLTALVQNLQELQNAVLACAEVDAALLGQCAAALKAAIGLLDLIIAGKSSDPENSFVVVGRTLLALQKIGREPDFSKMDFPSELALDSSACVVVKDENAKNDEMKLLQAFLEQELNTLNELEDDILALEKDDTTKALADLKRKLHTMKGEAGVMGAGEIAGVCHAWEDYLDHAARPYSTDMLMEVRDWLEQSVRLFCQGQKVVGSEQLIKKLGESAKTTEPPPPTPVCHPEQSEGSLSAAANTAEKTEILRQARNDTALETVPVPAKPAPTMDMDSVEIGDKDLAKEFVAEAQEYFESADENLLRLENNPKNAEAIGAVFRAFHTIKGIVGFLGLKPIGNLAHAAETLLDMVRNDKKPFAGGVVEVTFRALDMLKIMVADVNQAVISGSSFSPRPELLPIITRLHAIIDGGEIVPNKPLAIDKSASPEVTASTTEAEPEDKPTSDVGAAIKQAVKIDADRMDLLIDTIGELVIAESMVTQDAEIKSLRSLRVNKNMAHLGKITRMLQDMSMSMRMVPIEGVFRKMTRLVRDVAKKAGKRVELTLVGKETELDRAMVDKLNDPLVHMIRNSVDHGIETEEARVAAGKPPVGQVTLKAYHRGGNIHIELTDDGKGLDRDAILAKGIERGLIRADHNLSDKDIYALIFEPGFSTAKQVTEISGRGVGMDVVRKNLDAMRGSVLIDTVKGKGSTFTLVLPLTMAIIDGIMVRVGRETYIIPTLSIVESFRPSSDMLSTVIGKGEVIHFRDSLLPLFRVSALFGITEAEKDACRATIVVVEDNGKQTALLVDELLGQQQTVIKSLGAGMGTVVGISGASILTDGHPGLILDVGGIIKLAVGGEVKK